MVISMRCVLLASFVLLGACTAGAERAASLNALVGQPQTEVVRQLGVPTRTFSSGGHTFLAYEQEKSSTIYGGGPFFGGGFGYYGGGFGAVSAFPAEIVQRRCETTFEVVADRVQTWSLRGNACG
jgi:hypothetical protein